MLEIFGLGKLFIDCGDFVLRPPNRFDRKQWVMIRNYNYEYLQPFEGRWDDYPTTDDNFKFYLNRVTQKNGPAMGFLIFNKKHELMGGINMNNIRLGMIMGAELGYWTAFKHSNKGIMTRAIGAVCQYGFKILQLHRIESFIVPENIASQRVLEKNNFTFQGMVKEKFCINGQWRDHLCFYKLNNLI